MKAIRKKWKGSEVMDWRGRVYRFLGFGGKDRTQEHDVRLAGGTADIENGQLLNLKRFLRHIAFCNYKCLNTGHFPNSVVCFLLFCHEEE